MKKCKSGSSLFTFLSLMLLTLGSEAEGKGPLGLGLVLGNPTGISGKYWLDSRTSLDGLLGLDLGIQGDLTIGIDWTRHWTNFTPVQEGRFLLGAGVGPLLSMGRKPDMGVRVKGLADYEFEEAPLALFLEVAPGVMVFDPGFTITGGIGARWYFK